MIIEKYFNKKIPLNIKRKYYDYQPDVKSFYESEYLVYNPALHQEDSQKKTIVVKNILEQLKNSGVKISKIIDIGSGNILILKNLLDYLVSIDTKNILGLAVDISGNILESSENYEKIFKLRADATNLPLNNKSFDLALIIDLLEHINKPKLAVREASRVAKYIIAKIPLELSLYTLLRGGAKRLRYLEHKYGHINHYSEKTALELFEGKDIIYKNYEKIPNRSHVADRLQVFLLKNKFYLLFRLLFGGFIIVVIKNK